MFCETELLSLKSWDMLAQAAKSDLIQSYFTLGLFSIYISCYFLVGLGLLVISNNKLSELDFAP